MSIKGFSKQNLAPRTFVGGATPQINNEPWVRNPDWLDLPVLTESDNKFVGLHRVDRYSNFCALSAAGNYTVDWGDGVVENYAADVVAYHEYNYETYDVAGTTLCTHQGLEYKQAIIVVVPQAGQVFTTINLHQKHNKTGLQKYSSGFVDISIAGASLVNILIGVAAAGSGLQNIYFADLECANIVKCSCVDFSYLFYNCFSLKKIVDVDGSSCTNMSYMFNGCRSLTSVTLFNTASCTNMSYMFSGCYALASVPLFNTASCTNMSSMFSICYSLTSVPLFNTASCTNMSSMFNGCYSLTSIPLFNAAACTDMSSMFNGCYSLARVQIQNIKANLSVSACKLSKGALDEIYSNLATISGKTITVTNNHGTDADSPSIATAKGWIVTG